MFELIDREAKNPAPLSLDWKAVSAAVYQTASWIDDVNPLTRYFRSGRDRVIALDWEGVLYLAQHTNRLATLWQARGSSFLSVLPGKIGDKLDIFERPSGFLVTKLKELSRELIARINKFNVLCNKKGLKTKTDLSNCHNELATLIDFLRPYWHYLAELNAELKYHPRHFPCHYESNEYLPRFYWLFPELNLFFDLYMRECSVSIHLQNYLGYSLTWTSLSTMNANLNTLRKQIVDKNYYSLGSNRDLAHICDDELLQQIDQFARWFTKAQVEKHNFQDSHPAARRATQDLEYLIQVIRMHGDEVFHRFSSGLHHFKIFMGQVFKERESTLMSLRAQYNAAVLRYADASESILNARFEAQEKALSLQKKQEKAARLAAIKEAACLETLKNIEVCIDPTYNATTIDASSYQHIQYIIQTQGAQTQQDLRLASSTASNAETKAEAPLTQAPRPLPKKMTEHLFDKARLKEMWKALIPIYGRTEWQDCTIFGMTKAEWERLALLDLFNKLEKNLEALHGKQRPEEQEKSLKAANDALAEMLHALHNSPNYFAFQLVPDGEPCSVLRKDTDKFFRIYENMLLSDLQSAQRKLVSFHAQVTEIETELKAVQQGPGDEGGGPLKFFDSRGLQPKTAEAALRAIHDLIVKNLGAPCPSPHAAKIYQDILRQILETLAPAQPLLNQQQFPTF